MKVVENKKRRAGKISASMMCANFKDLESDIRALEEAKCEYLHFDIMDGQFVPNFTLGPDFMRAVREMTSIPFDIHLMVMRPEDHLQRFGIMPGDYVSFHTEACMHVQRTLCVIKERYGAKPMLALNPATPLSTLDYIIDSLDGVLLMTVNPGYAGQKLISATIDKISDLRNKLDLTGFSDIEIEVDGNVSFENAAKMTTAGADIFVAGSSSVFSKDMELRDAANLLRNII
ncbi:MAG: ribulose-phosphate 3-epimerase [Saccharofermentanales bacterium]